MKTKTFPSIVKWDYIKSEKCLLEIEFEESFLDQLELIFVTAFMLDYDLTIESDNELLFQGRYIEFVFFNQERQRKYELTISFNDNYMNMKKIDFFFNSTIIFCVEEKFEIALEYLFELFREE